MPYFDCRCRFRDLYFFPSSKQTRWSGVIERRIGHKGVGFGAAMVDMTEHDPGQIFGQCLPEDLVNYGLIPEFIGRLPVMSAVNQLTRSDLISILPEPRNALTKQFQKFFNFDGIELVFSDDALVAIAHPDHRALLD